MLYCVFAACTPAVMWGDFGSIYVVCEVCWRLYGVGFLYTSRLVASMVPADLLNVSGSSLGGVCESL